VFRGTVKAQGRAILLRGDLMLDLLTENDVSKRLNVSVASLRRWRLQGRGPAFLSRSGAWCGIARRISTPGLHICGSAGTLAKGALRSHKRARRAELESSWRSTSSPRASIGGTSSPGTASRSARARSSPTSVWLSKWKRRTGRRSQKVRDKKPVPTLKDFAEHDFLPFRAFDFLRQGKDPEILRVRRQEPARL
jgi:hypothetical protein